jgi:prephenate dehydrogenase
MGRWFTNYLLSKGHTLTLYDRARRKTWSSRAKTVRVAQNLRDAVSTSDLILVSVPLSSVKQVLRECRRYLRSGSILVEITSLKLFIMKDLKNLTSKGVVVSSIHPMLGPSTRSVAGKLIIHIPVKGDRREVEVVQGLMPDARLRSMPASVHDRMMAYVLGLPYVLNAIFIASLRGKNLRNLKGSAGSTFTSQLTLAESLTESTGSIIPEILVLNPYSRQILSKARELFQTISESVEKRDPKPIDRLLNPFLRTLKSSRG